MPLGEVVISERYGYSPRRYTVSGIRASWEVSRAGALSCFIPLSAVRAAGWPSFKGLWVRYEHPSGPVFGGVITVDKRQPGAWEIAAESFHVLLRKRRTARLSRSLRATAGALFVRTVGDTDNGDPLGLRSIRADESGEAIRLDARAMDLYGDVVPTLLRSGDFEWDVTPDRDAYFGIRVGVDRRATVHLCEGRHIVDPWSLPGDLWTITNDLLGIPAKSGYADTAGYVEEDKASIQRYGRLQDTIVTSERSKATIIPVVRRRLKRLKDPLSLLSLTLVNVDGCFGWFGIGDTIRISLGSAGVVVDYRPMAIALDEESGTMTTAGDVVRVVAGAI